MTQKAKIAVIGLGNIGMPLRSFSIPIPQGCRERSLWTLPTRSHRMKMVGLGRLLTMTSQRAKYLLPSCRKMQNL